jgi:UPF0716 protein FxsA
VVVVLAVVFLVLPIVELAVLVQVAHGIGVLNTIGLLLAVSFVGGWLVKREGLAAWRRLTAAIDRRQLPHREVVDGALILLAGALLLTPGFVSDVLGVILLLPPTRAVVRKVVFGALARRTVVGRVVVRGRP